MFLLSGFHGPMGNDSSEARGSRRGLDRVSAGLARVIVESEHEDDKDRTIVQFN